MFLQISTEQMSAPKRRELDYALIKGVNGVIDYSPKAIKVSGDRADIEATLAIIKRFRKVR